MRLEEAILGIVEHGSQTAVCAREPFGAGSEACIVDLDESFAVPNAVVELGLKYFLGREEIGRLLEYGTEIGLPSAKAVELICHFAVFDAFPDWAQTADTLPPRASRRLPPRQLS